MQQFTFHVMPSKHKGGPALLPLNGSRKETASDVEVFMIILSKIVLLPASSMLVASRTTGVFTHAGLWMYTHVLPMPITTNYDHVPLFGNKSPQLITFMREI